MEAGTISILCTGDVHIGRHPTRIPSELDGEQFSPSAVWHRTVETALRHEVDLVALTGDVVDRENRYFEAYGDVEHGIQQLDAGGIPTVAVAGNHDYDVFPRLVDELEIESFHLLGADGTWERQSIALENGRELHVDGWSFSQAHVLESPLERYDLTDEDRPTIGLLHADLGVKTSEYAPVDLGSLLETSVNGWLLGHIHRPRVHHDENPFVVYPGSPQPLDPGERGRHGPWLLTIDEHGTVSYEQLPLSTVRYDRLDVDVTGVSDPKAVPPLVRDELEAVLGDGPTGEQELLLARVTLTGRTDTHAALYRQRSSIEDDLGLVLDGTTVRLEKLQVDTRPAVDLANLSDGDSPAAYLARLLQSLDEGTDDEFEGVVDDELGGVVDDERAEIDFGGLVDDALAAMRSAHQANAYLELRREDAVDSPTRSDAIEMLETQARLLLDELIAQREEPI